MKRLFRHALWLGPVLLVGLAGVLLRYGGCDVRYVARVLVRRESNTDDYLWKRSMPVAASRTPAPWNETHACGAVSAAFGEPDAPDMASYLTRGGALAFVVIRDGALACEWYGNGGAHDRPAAAFSVSKTVTSLILARAVAQGVIGSIDDPISRYVPALATRDARFSAISLASLVDMRSGIAFDDDEGFPWVNRDPPRVYYASDLATTVVDHTRIAAAPGGFVYNDYAPNLLGLAIERSYHAQLAPGPMQALWSELGAEYPAAWSVDDHGFAWHESGLVVTARDLARIGELMLDHGKVGDRQVAPPAFLDRSLAPAGRAPIVEFAGTKLGYHNGWWLPGADLLYAMGHHGQIMIVSLATRTVIVRLGLDDHDANPHPGFDGHDENNVSIANRLARLARRLAP